LRTIQEHTTAFEQQLNQLGINDVLEECEESLKAPLMSYATCVVYSPLDPNSTDGTALSKR